MAAITVDDVVLTSVIDPDDRLFINAHTVSQTVTPNVTIAAYGNAPLWRTQRTPGAPIAVKASFVSLTTDAANWLRAHQGAVVCYRDTNRLNFYGTVTADSFDPYTAPGIWSSSITVTLVTINDLL